MPFVPIPFSKGAFQNVQAFELNDPSNAVAMENFLLDDAGSNVDRPGLWQFASLGVSSPVIGSYYFSLASCLVAVTEARRIYSITQAGVVTDITGSATLGGSSRPVFAEDGTYLAIAGGGAPITWSGSGNCALMAGSPVNCSHILYLDGYWINFLLNDNELRIAGPTPAARLTWNTSDFFAAEGLPSNIQAIANLNRQLFIFKTDSFEVFQNFGSTSTPFQRVSGGFLDRGTPAPYSVIEANNTLFFLDSKRNFCFLQGIIPQVISIPFDKQIQAMTTVSDCWAMRLDIEGYYLIAWVFPTAQRIFVFDYAKQEYVGEWNGFLNGQTVRHQAHSHAFSVDWNQHFIGDYQTGIIWQLSRSFKVDGTQSRRMLRRTGEIDHGTGTRKRNKSYRFYVERGVGTLNQPEPQLMIRFRDDGKAWSTPINAGLGMPGDSPNYVQIFNTGTYRKRQIEVSCTEAVEVIIRGAEEDVEQLGY